MGGSARLTAIVFDFDGVIIDTETPIFQSWQWAYEEHGAEPLTHEEWSKQVGTVNGLDVEEILRTRAGRVDQHILERRLAMRSEMTASQPILPGVEAWLDQADALGIALAIASSSLPEWVLGHLDRLGLRQRFGPVLCRSERHAPKPRPDLYRAACEALDVSARHALAVEDSPHGITAAKAAGLECLAVPNPITVELDLSAADLVVSSLAAVTVSDAADRLW